MKQDPNEQPEPDDSATGQCDDCDDDYAQSLGDAAE